MASNLQQLQIFFDQSHNVLMLFHPTWIQLAWVPQSHAADISFFDTDIINFAVIFLYFCKLDVGRVLVINDLGTALIKCFALLRFVLDVQMVSSVIMSLLLLHGF